MSSSVETLSRGPTRIHISGARTVEEAIELDRDLQRVLREEKFVGIEVFYELPSETEGSDSMLYPAALLVKEAKIRSEIKRYQQDAARQNATNAGSIQDRNQNSQPESKEHSQ